jgi:hypothetical protein
VPTQKWPPKSVGLIKANSDIKEEITSNQITYQEYAKVPWYRKSSINSVLLFLQLFTWSFFPFSLCVCVVLLTGDVYYNQKDKNGNLKRWGIANKTAAAVLSVVCIAIMIF